MKMAKMVIAVAALVQFLGYLTLGYGRYFAAKENIRWLLLVGVALAFLGLGAIVSAIIIAV